MSFTPLPHIFQSCTHYIFMIEWKGYNYKFTDYEILVLQYYVKLFLKACRTFFKKRKKSREVLSSSTRRLATDSSGSHAFTVEDRYFSTENHCIETEETVIDLRLYCLPAICIVTENRRFQSSSSMLWN